MKREIPDPESCIIYPCKVYKPDKKGLKLERVWSKKQLLRRDWSMNVRGNAWGKVLHLSAFNRRQLGVQQVLADLEYDRQQQQ